MSETILVKRLRHHPEKCDGCRKCEEACSKVHFKEETGGELSAIRILEKDGAYSMHVCDQRGLCLDMCPVGALERKKIGAVILDKKVCVACQACVGFCPIGAMRRAPVRLEPFKCISCGSCVKACPKEALELEEVPLDEIAEVVLHSYHGMEV